MLLIATPHEVPIETIDLSVFFAPMLKWKFFYSERDNYSKNKIIYHAYS